jgi:hypothetical protein
MGKPTSPDKIFALSLGNIYLHFQRRILPKWQNKIANPLDKVLCVNKIAETACTIMHCVGILA